MECQELKRIASIVSWDTEDFVIIHFNMFLVTLKSEGHILCFMTPSVNDI